MKKSIESPQGLSKRQTSSSGAVAWHPENLGEGRGKREKLDFSPISCTRLGLLGGGGVCSFWAALVATDPARNCVHLPGAGMPGHQSCRTAAREGEGRHSQGPGSAGRDVEIQTEGSLLPSALLTLFEIEL